MASRGVHCLLPGLKVAAWAEGPDVQNSSGWPCQWVFLSCPLHLLWPHSGWYMLPVVLGVPRAAGYLLCYVAVVLGCLFCPSLADGLPLPSLAGRWLLRARSEPPDALQQALALPDGSALQR